MKARRAHTHILSKARCKIWAKIVEKIQYLQMKQNLHTYFRLTPTLSPFVWVFQKFSLIAFSLFLILFYSFLPSRMHLLMPLKDSLCSARWIMGSLMCCSTIPPKSCCVLWGPTLPGWGPVTPPYWRLLTAKVQWSRAVMQLLYNANVNIVNY